MIRLAWLLLIPVCVFGFLLYVAWCADVLSGYSRSRFRTMPFWVWPALLTGLFSLFCGLTAVVAFACIMAGVFG